MTAEVWIGLSLLLGFGCHADVIQKPNVVVFLVDDMGIRATSIPFLTDESGQAKRYPLNDFYRTPGNPGTNDVPVDSDHIK